MKSFNPGAKLIGPYLALGLTATALISGCGGGSGGGLDVPSATPTPLTGATPGPNSGGRIAFVSTRDGNPEIYLMNADGSGQTRLTNNPANDSTPAFSPDGRKIAFVSNRNGNQDIYVMNADGSGLTRLTSNALSDVSPAFSPDGRRIAFSSNRSGNFQIYTMNIDGTGVARITNDSAVDDQPTFSPQGNKIAFVRTVTIRGAGGSSGGGDVVFSRIYNVNTNGSSLTRVTNVSDNFGYHRHPVWSPDGRKIAYDSDRPQPVNIHLINSDGTNDVRLTSSQFPTENFDPAFSPDGRSIAFVSNRNGNEEIYVMNADGSRPTRLTNSPARDAEPSWGRTP